MREPRVLALVGDENGCSLWRTFLPFAELARRGRVAEWAPLDRAQDVLPLVAGGLFDAIILPRLSWKVDDQAAARGWIRSLHNAGLAVLYEVDDDVFTPQIAPRQQATTESEKSLDQLKQERLDRISALRLCDGVTVSNKALARVVQQYTDAPVVVVPNAIDTRWWRRVLRGVRRVVPPLTIGWAGGARYQEDLAPIAEAWHTIAKRHPAVTFVVQGFLPDVLVEAVPAERVRLLPWLPIEEYPRALLNVDIGCANVADIQFNRCKTPIKLWEYTMAGAVSVVSPTLYGEVALDGEDCLIAETASEWTAALSRLVDDPHLRRRLWRAQRRRIAHDHSLEKNILRWPDAWARIISTRPRLLLAG